MAGRGPAPKLPAQRRRSAKPERGEWRDLPALLERPVLPRFNPSWQVPRHLWAAWRSDTATSTYTAADIGLAVYLAESFNDLSDPSRIGLMDRLALTARGRRDLRLRAPTEAPPDAAEPAAVKRLRLIERPDARDAESG